MHHYMIASCRGDVAAYILAPEQFDGEHNCAGWLYFGSTWLVSVFAMATNLGQAIFRKLTGQSQGTLGQILWALGRDPKHYSSLFVDRISRYCHQAKYGAAGWRSLDVFYNYHEKVKPKLGSNLEGLITHHWLGKSHNRQAVTNRLKIAIDLLAQSLDTFAKEPEIRRLSIASGSAQAVVEAMKRRPGLNVRVLLIDADSSALNEARKLVRESGLEDRFSYVVDTTKALEQAGRDFEPHAIEMIGFLDYRPRQKAIALIRRIKEQLPQGGLFLTSNIHPNRRRYALIGRCCGR